MIWKKHSLIGLNKFQPNIISPEMTSLKYRIYQWRSLVKTSVGHLFKKYWIHLKTFFFKGSIDDLVLTNCGLENELENLHDKYNELVNKFTNKNNDQAVDEVMIDTLPHMLWIELNFILISFWKVYIEQLEQRLDNYSTIETKLRRYEDLNGDLTRKLIEQDNEQNEDRVEEKEEKVFSFNDMKAVLFLLNSTQKKLNEQINK